MIGLPLYSTLGGDHPTTQTGFFLTPGPTISSQSISQGPMYWPGVTYPWMPWLPGWSGYSTPPPIDPLNAATRICLGNQCWPYARMSSADAEQIKQTLMEKSWPLEYVGLAAIALYDKGYRAQASAVLNVYGGIYGVDEVAQQIQRIYDGRTGPSVVPTGAREYGAFALMFQ